MEVLEASSDISRLVIFHLTQLVKRTEERTKLKANVAVFNINEGELVLDVFPVSGPDSDLYSQLHLSRAYLLVEELHRKLVRQAGKFDGDFILSQPGLFNPFGDNLAGLEGTIEVGDDAYLTRFNADSAPVPWGAIPYMYLIDISKKV